MSKTVFATDWLASQPVFFNIKTKKISHNINDVIDFESVEFDPEGLENYLEFGYSVFGKTPIRDVHFLDHSSTILRTKTNELQINQKDDIAEQIISDGVIPEDEVIDLITSEVNQWEKEQEQIILPMSGGYDSRFLSYAIKDKQKINAFSYGVSSPQSSSKEVVFAQKIAEIQRFKWHQIKIENYHKYFSTWDAIYGPSTHAHGMYQIDFYEKIHNQHVSSPASLLSGIIGDAWADKNKIEDVSNASKLKNLGYSHGMHADASACLLKSSKYLKTTYFEKNKQKLSDERMRTILSMRLKLMLLNYLFKIPSSYGYKPWSPFLLPHIALSMLRIAPHRRSGRAWQKDFFVKHGIYVEQLNLSANNFNTLNSVTINQHPLPLLSSKLLKEIIDPKYIEWINLSLSTVTISSKLVQYLLNQRVFNVLLPQLGIKNSQLSAYFAYLTLKPLQFVLEKRAGNE